MTRAAQQAPAVSEHSMAEQAKQKVQGTTQQAQSQAGRKAEELKTEAGQRLRAQIDERSTEAGEQVSSTAQALRRVGEQLRSEQQNRPAQLAEQAAERTERLGRYLTEADSERILRDLEHLARRRPWLVMFTGAAMGFLASRFVKASAERADGGSTDGRRSLTRGARSEVGTAAFSDDPVAVAGSEGGSSGGAVQ
jgi:hypothetical protein